MLVPLPQQFAPDQSNYNPGASALIQNAQPIQDGWAPVKALGALSSALASAPRGALAVKSDAGSYFVYAGTATNLYVLASSDYTWTEKSSSTDAYDLGTDVFWRFARWGNQVIATAPDQGGTTYPQIITLDGAGNFGNLTNATFEAALVAVVGDFVVFGRIDTNNRQLRWSGVNDATFWTVGERGSDTQTMPDGGQIQAILPQAQDAIIVQEDRIRLMQFAPQSGYTFVFPTLDPARGAFSSRSVVSIAPNDFVFLSKDGFYRWQGGNMIPIGAERVNEWFFDNCSASEAALTSGLLDPFNKVVHWRFEQNDGNSAILSYDWQLDRWYYQSNNAQDILPAATAGETLATLTTLYSTLSGMPYVLGSRFYQGGIPGLAGFDSDNKFGFFDGDNLEAIIETEDKALNYPRRAITDRITVMADTQAAQVAIATKEDQSDMVSFGAYLSAESNKPFINSRKSGRWHRFRVKIPAATTWTNAVGIDVNFVDGGDH